MERPINLSDKEKEWKNIRIQESEYVISTSVGKNSWKVSLSNLIEIWTEEITRETALARCQSLNVLLDLETFNIEEILDVLLNDIPKYAFGDRSVNEIKLQNDIDGVAFNFRIKLIKGNPQHFWNEITRPLCRSFIELQRRHKIMVNLIKKKDEEILEYKLSGAELTRKKIETLPYNDEIFRNEVSIGKGETEECVNAFQSIMQLYNEFKKFESSSISKTRSPSPAEHGIKTEIQNPDEISETTPEFNINGVERRSEIETEITTAGSSVVEHRRKGKQIMNNDICKTDSGIQRNLKGQSVPKIVANVPTSSREQARHKKLKQGPDIYKIIR